MDLLRVYKSPFSKQRIGPNSDGGYVICNMNGDYDGFISGGIGNDIRFEQHFLHLYPKMTCLAFDGTIKSLPWNIDRLIFYSINLGNTNTDTLTDLHDVLKSMNNVFMKIDIEGHEFRLLPKLIEHGDIHKIKQLIIEIHTPADIQLFPDYFKGLQDITQETMDSVLAELNKTHRLVHFHGNNGCKQHTRENIICPNVFECTFVRLEDCKEINWEFNTNPIPSQLDYPNVYHKPELMLSGFPYTV